VPIPDGPDREAKATLLAATCGAIETDLDGIRPAAEGRAWLGSVTAFYAREVTRA
jgi:hypothetical protein